MVSQSKLFARECGQHAGSLLPYVGTRSAARDLDVLRAALGDRKLTYLGKSYGTYLGAWYAQLFPRHVRALVLDGALDPDATSTDINITQGEGFEVALRSFTANCMRLAGCPLGQGGDVSAGIARLQGLLNRATRTPLANGLGDGRPANGSLLLEGVVAALYAKAYWPVLTRALKSAFGGDGTLLIELGDSLLQRSPNGSYTNLADANMAINCLDRPWPRALSDVALDRVPGRKGGTAVRRVYRLGQPGLRLLAGQVGSAAEDHRGGRPAHPGGGNHAGSRRPRTGGRRRWPAS